MNTSNTSMFFCGATSMITLYAMSCGMIFESMALAVFALGFLMLALFANEEK